MKLIIAEKPSLGRNIASALGANKKGNGYLESDKYIVSWAFGHLFALKDIDDYLGKKTPWKDVELPFIPAPFQFRIKSHKNEKTGKLEPDSGILQQVKTIQALGNRNDVTEIVNAGDADREGQIIVDIIIDKIKCNKPITRLWLPEQTEKTIKEQIKSLDGNDKYFTLAQEGYARTFMDWIFGINLTRYVSLKVNKMLPVGRVLIPIVKYIYDRDIEIRNFIKKKYFQLESRSEKDGVEIPLILRGIKYDYDKLQDATLECQKLNSNLAFVSSIEKKSIKKVPSKLFSLSKLQSILSKKNKIDFNKSLEIIQSLYEKGYITYPRTNTEYLSTNEKGKVKDIISSLSEYPLEFKDSKKVFDDSKIESHSAIIPTTKKPISLNSMESIIYNTILNRFISNFLKEETVTEKVTITINVSDKEFKLNGESIKSLGFFKYEPEKFENQLPILFKGDEFKVDFQPIEKETSPPKKVSEEDLANYLKNPFKKDTDSEEEEYKAILEGVEIGTEATRTGIVENAKKYKYISQKGAIFSIEPLGEKLIEILDKLKINMYKEKSVEFSKFQKRVFKGESTLKELTDFTAKEISKIIGLNIPIEKFKSEYNSNSKEDTRIPIGKCFKCGLNLYEGPKAFYCDGYKSSPPCKNSLFKNNKLVPNISMENSIKLLNGEEVLFKDLKSSKGNVYSAFFKLVEEERFCNLKLIKFHNENPIKKGNISFKKSNFSRQDEIDAKNFEAFNPELK